MVTPKKTLGYFYLPLCGKSVDLAYLASHPTISHVVGIDPVRNAAVDFAAEEHPKILPEKFHMNAYEVENEEEQHQ